MKPAILQKIVSHYNLGDIINFKPINGGWVHSLCELNASKGKYFIKRLNPYFSSSKKFSQHIEFTEKTARHYLREGIPAVPALTMNNRVICKLGNQMFLLFPFAQGAPLTTNNITEHHAFLVGKMLGEIHRLNLSPEKTIQPDNMGLTDDYWHRLLNKGKKQKMPWFSQLSDKLKNISLWNHAYSQAWPILKKNNVLSHRDLTQRNILWYEENNFQIIDWEWAGLTYPCCELLDTALNWSGILHLKIDKKLFMAIIAGYRSITELFFSDMDENAVYGCLGNWLHWTAFNIERSLKSNVQQNDFSIALQQINYTFKSLQILHKNTQEILKWLKK